MTKQIPLRGKYGNGKFAVVDDDDYDRLVKYSWHCTPYGYASGGARAQRELGHHFMHRILCCPPDGMYPDHINGNTLDNRKENLRPVTPSQNLMNTGIRKNKVSKYKGVWWNDLLKWWYAAISKDGETFNLGVFRTQRDAAIAYNNAATEMFGEYARLNDIPEHDPDDKPFMRIRPKRGGKSQYTGVTVHYGGWHAYIKPENAPLIHLGTYPSEKLAALIYDAAAITRYGDDAIRHVNFPDLISTPLNLNVRFAFVATPKGKQEFKGVGKTSKRRYQVEYRIGGKQKFSYFNTAIEAAEYYDKCVLQYDTHKSVYLNFPDKLEQYLSELGELPAPVQVPSDDLLA